MTFLSSVVELADFALAEAFWIFIGAAAASYGALLGAESNGGTVYLVSKRAWYLWAAVPTGAAISGSLYPLYLARLPVEYAFVYCLGTNVALFVAGWIIGRLEEQLHEEENEKW